MAILSASLGIIDVISSRTLDVKQPVSNIKVNKAMKPSPSVEIYLGDEPETEITGGTISVKLADPQGATLSGETVAPIINAVATFNNLTVDLPGDYELIAECDEDSLDWRPPITNKVAVYPFTSNLVNAVNSAQVGSFTRNSVAWYEDDDGIVKQVGTHTPRFSAKRGVLIEVGSTNLVPYSTQVDQWSLNTGSTGIEANATIAPDGTNTAFRINMAEVSSSTENRWIQPLSTSLSGYATFSVYMKADSPATVYLFVNRSDTSTYPASLACELTTEWKRYILKTPSLANATYIFRIGVDRRAGHDVVPEQSFYVWGAQVEAGSLATSPMLTTGTTFTRQPEVITIPSGGWPISPGKARVWYTPIDTKLGQPDGADGSTGTWDVYFFDSMITWPASNGIAAFARYDGTTGRTYAYFKVANGTTIRYPSASKVWKPDVSVPLGWDWDNTVTNSWNGDIYEPGYNMNGVINTQVETPVVVGRTGQTASGTPRYANGWIRQLEVGT